MATEKRELMVSLWYPTNAHEGDYPSAPWLPRVATDSYLDGVGVGSGNVAFGDTRGLVGAPVDRSRGNLPVVLYSPGANASRAFGTGVVQELASRGYVVVTVDHTYDAAVVEFPGNRVVTNPDGEITDYDKAVSVRVDDTRFVLDQLELLESGSNPDVDGAALPTGLPGALDLTRIGMMGHSLGAASTASAMYADGRIKAGMGLDGGGVGPVVEGGLDRPFLVVDTEGKGGKSTNPVLQKFWSNLRGWRLNLTLQGAAHHSFGDDAQLIPIALPFAGVSSEDIQEMVGTIPTDRALAFQRAYPLAFFDLQLRGVGHLLDGTSADFPEVAYSR
ncbi:alpha/beta hydrolase family protein [Rhodococcus sp. ACT016]|uniref:alpha/beta hydrolase family protein n=1 Tax=Rhodococcus sp. ACT016 TaxID=3134808 RepID=UPI003D2DEE0C